ncbi:Transcriptional regulatory protein, C terminal [Alicyclobacillus hesperidum]|uniref:Transcriptional regulatory protein, C terminal n=1 Tax=Alicyclobacillus hesperidum TaxID=89784 RepID=A0A1H2YNH1_9BACL|nr:Transcriptional regulatory protein, C terminal [Alicyclobacillus hesperidum]
MVYLDEDFYLDVNRFLLVKNGFPISLSLTEFLILRCLSESLERPVSTPKIIEYAWGQADMIQIKHVHVYINRIRSKLEPYPKNLSTC